VLRVSRPAHNDQVNQERLMANGQHTTWFQGIHSTGNSSMHESSAMKVGGRMVKTFQAYLPDCHRTYSCVHCRAHLANHDELISKSFQGSQGRAYLFNSV